jgi:hypothetical protein
MPQQTTQQYFKALSVLHFALITGVTLFIVIAYFLRGAIAHGNNEALANIFQYIVPVLAFICIAAGNVLYKKRVNDIKNKKNLAEKLNDYRAAFILRDALLEGAALFAIIAYMLCSELILLGVAILLVLIFVFIKPTKDKLIKDLELSSDETVIIEDDNAVID